MNVPWNACRITAPQAALVASMLLGAIQVISETLHGIGPDYLQNCFSLIVSTSPIGFRSHIVGLFDQGLEEWVFSIAASAIQYRILYHSKLDWLQPCCFFQKASKYGYVPKHRIWNVSRPCDVRIHPYDCQKNKLGFQLEVGFHKNKWKWNPAAVGKGDLFISKSKRFPCGGSYGENEVQKCCFIGEFVIGVGLEGCVCVYVLVLGWHLRDLGVLTPGQGGD